MPRKRVEGSENKSTKTTTAKRGTVKSAETKTKEIQAKVTEDTQRLEDIGEPVIEETLTETDEENNSVEVKITTDEEAGSDVVVEENQPWSEEDKRALDAFQSLPQANQKLYDKLMQDALRPEKYVSSGSFILDAVLSNGDGIPMGTFIEVTAPAYTGKSSMLLFVAKNLCKQGYRCAYIDSERGLNQKQVDSFGLTRYVTNKMFLPITTYDTFEKVDDFLVETLNDPSLNFIFIDSLTAVSPQSMIDKTASESQTMAIHARYTSNFLRRFRSLFTGTDKTIFFIAQNRKQFTQYGAQDSAAGGEAQKHYMDIIIEMKPKSKLKRTVKGYAEPIEYGSECIIKTKKNRFCASGVPKVITIVFGRGVSNASALYDALESNDRIKQRGSFYTLEGIDGVDVQFRGKDAVKAYISKNNVYYTDLVERLGGIRLVKQGNAIGEA